MGSFAQFHKRSIEDRDNFWAEQAKIGGLASPAPTNLRLLQSSLR